jgi:hypothetical protein
LRYHHDVQGGYSANVDTKQAIAEAMGWLRAYGMIALRPGDTADAAIFLTRRGHEVLTEDLNSVRAA